MPKENRNHLFVVFFLIYRLLDVDDIVTHLLELGDCIHVVDTRQVVIYMPGYVQRILSFQVVAEVVDLRLDAHHLHELAVGDMYFIQRLYHLVRSLSEQRFHHFDIAVLLLGVWQPVAMTVRDLT